MLSNKLITRFIDAINSSNGYEQFNYCLCDGSVVLTGSNVDLLLFHSFLKAFLPQERFILEYDLSGVLSLKISVYAE